MKRIRNIAIVVILIGIVGFRLYFNKKQIEANNKVVVDTNFAIPVILDEVKKHKMGKDFSVNGSFNPARELTLLSEGQGKVVQLFVNNGDWVNEGQQIAKLDDELASSQLLLAQASFDKAKKDLERFEGLAKTEAITNQQLEEARLGFSNARNNLTMAKKLFDNSVIKSPISGTITKKFVETGTLVMPSVPVVEIVDVNKLKFITSVSEGDLPKVIKGQKIKVKADIYPDFEFPGEIIMIGVKADESKRFPVEIEINNDKIKTLKAGLFGTAFLSFKESGQTLVIPRKAIIGSLKEPQVYIVKDNVAILKNIRIGQVNENEVEVLSELQEGDKVVVSGQINLQDSTKVTVVNK